MNQPIPFNLSLARSLAEWSARAYQRDGLQLVAPNTGATVLVQDVGDAIVLAFRGTKCIRDWLTDVHVLTVNLGGAIAVHSGFMASVDSILPHIVEYLLPAGADKALVKPLLITGHSLGGADAVLAAYFLQREGFNVQAVYTFASPRVGNAAWRWAYNELCGHKTYRIACAGDLVPLLPGVLAGYRHVGMEAFLDGSLLLMRPPNWLELVLDTWRAYVAIKCRDVDFLLEFHSIQEDYLASLNRASNSDYARPR